MTLIVFVWILHTYNSVFFAETKHCFRVCGALVFFYIQVYDCINRECCTKLFISILQQNF